MNILIIFCEYSINEKKMIERMFTYANNKNVHVTIINKDNEGEKLKALLELDWYIIFDCTEFTFDCSNNVIIP